MPISRLATNCIFEIQVQVHTLISITTISIRLGQINSIIPSTVDMHINVILPLLLPVSIIKIECHSTFQHIWIFNYPINKWAIHKIWIKIIFNHWVTIWCANLLQFSRWNSEPQFKILLWFFQNSRNKLARLLSIICGDMHRRILKAQPQSTF